jgi:hypothetical protein
LIVSGGRSMMNYRNKLGIGLVGWGLLLIRWE